MITIWKYEIPIADKFTLKMPKGAKLLSVQTQFEIPALWAWIDSNEPFIERHFLLFGTGHHFPEKFECFYIGTFQMGGFVGHLFEEIKEAKE